MENDNKKVDMVWLTELRSNLHKKIFDKITDTEHTALEVVRTPNQSKKQPASKLIIVVGSENQANELKEKCLELIASTNESIRKEMQKDITLTRYEIRYSINIIHSESDIMLSVCDAQRRKKMKGSDIKKLLEKLQEGFSNLQKEEQALLEKSDNESKNKSIAGCVRLLEDKKEYTFAESTGYSYRVTYFNGKYREQISVGNILIVVSDGNIQIINTPTRKQRTDKKDYVCHIGGTGLREMYIYPI